MNAELKELTDSWINLEEVLRKENKKRYGSEVMHFPDYIDLVTADAYKKQSTAFTNDCPFSLVFEYIRPSEGFVPANDLMRIIRGNGLPAENYLIEISPIMCYYHSHEYYEIIPPVRLKSPLGPITITLQTLLFRRFHTYQIKILP